MDLPFDLFKIDQNDIKPAQGKILISEPFLVDEYFRRSVILLTEHGDNGSVGFLLNKPLDVGIDELVSDFPDKEAFVSMGGPVGTNTVHYIHLMGDLIPNSVKVYKNIYWGGDFEIVKEMMRAGKIDPDKIRFFVGYSGWEPKQLEREISENSWVIGQFDEKTIMECKSPFSWHNLLDALGGKYRLWTNFPDNPGLN